MSPMTTLHRQKFPATSEMMHLGAVQRPGARQIDPEPPRSCRSAAMRTTEPAFWDTDLTQSAGEAAA